jgi:hypothetical protein
LIAAALFAASALGHAAGDSGGSCAVAGSSPCVIELHGPQAPKLSANCSAEPWTRYVKLMLPGRFVDSDKNGWWETVVEIALDPSKECGCATIRIEFQDPVAAWSVNVGDSPTNNGFGGDAGTTIYAAEMQILGDLLSVFTAGSPNLAAPRFDGILQSSLPLLGGKHVDLEICDQVLVFDMPGGLVGGRPIHWRLQTPASGLLYSLAPRPGHAGTEGANRKDRGIYAGFNRTVTEGDPGRSARIGTGVRRVEITLAP